jgi:PhoH-like ATPase
VGLTAQDYTTDKVDIADLYPGVCELMASATAMEQLKSEGGLALAALPAADGVALQANEGVTLVDQAQPNHTLLVRFDAASQRLLPLQRAGKVRLGKVSPATVSKPSPSICCWILRCSCSPWWVKPVPAKHCLL